MQSATKSSLDPAQAAAVAAATWGPDAVLTAVTELTGGAFNASHRLDLADGRTGVLRIAPPADVTLMRAEHQLLHAEAEALSLVGALTALPVPRLLHLDSRCSILSSPYLVAETLPGTSLHETRESMDAAAVQRAEEYVGQVLTTIHRITGPAFGLLGPGATRSATWAPIALGLINGVLADAEAVGVHLADDLDEVRALVRRHAWALDAVRTPRLVHWDLWDGNVFVVPATGEVTGIIDWERSLWGDPLAEEQFRAHHARGEGLAGRLANVPGYVPPPTRGPAADDEAAAWLRCLLYDLYLYGLMTVECTYRHYPEPHYGPWAFECWTTALTALRALDR